MKKAIPYTIFILLLFLLMYWLNKDAPVRYQWIPSFKTGDKEPFGAYALDKMLKDSWDTIYEHNYYSLYDLAAETVKYPEDETEEDTTDISSEEYNTTDYSDENHDTVEYSNQDYSGEIYDTARIQPDYNLLIIANRLYLDTTEVKFLLKYVEKGGSVILAANTISGQLADTLNIDITARSNFVREIFDLSINRAGEEAHFCASDSEQATFTFPSSLVNNYFEYANIIEKNNVIDSVKNTYSDSLYRISVASGDNTISLRYAIGKGNLVLVANPLIFTNYGILNDSINPYIWKHLAYLEGKPLMRTEYYQTGSQGGQSQSEFRVLLKERSLKWAFYTTLIGILVFMIFTAKRKQKIIPVLNPPANKMLAFVGSIAGLYLLKNNNADLLLKKQIYWGEELKRKYGIDIVNEQHDYEFYKRVAAKTRQPVEDVRRLFLNLGAIDENSLVSDEEMVRLVAKMNVVCKT
jgi:hypothetical protein